jgi:hypothetical protein
MNELEMTGPGEEVQINFLYQSRFSYRNPVLFAMLAFIVKRITIIVQWAVACVQVVQLSCLKHILHFYMNYSHM